MITDVLKQVATSNIPRVMHLNILYISAAYPTLNFKTFRSVPHHPPASLVKSSILKNESTPGIRGKLAPSLVDLETTDKFKPYAVTPNSPEKPWKLPDNEKVEESGWPKAVCLASMISVWPGPSGPGWVLLESDIRLHLLLPSLSSCLLVARYLVELVLCSPLRQTMEGHAGPLDWVDFALSSRLSLLFLVWRLRGLLLFTGGRPLL